MLKFWGTENIWVRTRTSSRTKFCPGVAHSLTWRRKIWWVIRTIHKTWTIVVNGVFRTWRYTISIETVRIIMKTKLAGAFQFIYFGIFTILYKSIVNLRGKLRTIFKTGLLKYVLVHGTTFSAVRYYQIYLFDHNLQLCRQAFEFLFPKNWNCFMSSDERHKNASHDIFNLSLTGIWRMFSE